MDLAFHTLRLACLALPFLALGCGGGKDDEPEQNPLGDAGPVVILDGGGGVPQPPDGVAACPQVGCNYQAQSGCAGSEGCIPGIDNQRNVVAECHAVGTKAAGEACSDYYDCAAGLFCAANVCRTLCCGGDWSACPSGESCIRELSIQVSGRTVASGASLCFPVNDCDVLAANSCPNDPGRACAIVDPIGNVACAPVGSGTAGSACSEASPCAAGHSCVGGTCRRLCRAVENGGEPACPPAEGICIHYDRDPAGVGECTPAG